MLNHDVQHDQHGNPVLTPKGWRKFDTYNYPHEWQAYVDSWSIRVRGACDRYGDTALRTQLACRITDNDVPF